MPLQFADCWYFILKILQIGKSKMGITMQPNSQDTPQTYDIFRSQLTQIINMEHELVGLL